MRGSARESGHRAQSVARLRHGDAITLVILVVELDILGRIVARPGEVQVGVMLALVGAPFLIVMVRRQRLGTV